MDAVTSSSNSSLTIPQASTHKRRTKSWFSDWSVWYWLESAHLPPRWGSVTGQSGFVYTISLRVGITSTRPARMLAQARRLCLCAHTSPSSAAALLCLLSSPLLLMLLMLMLLLSLAQTRGGSRVAPQRQDWVGYIPALMPGPYGWHVIGKSHHMRAGDWHAAAFTETGFPLGERDSPSVTELKEKME